MVDERRRVRRVPVKVIANCVKNWSAIEEREKFSAYTRNVSTRGVYLITSRKVDVRDKFLIGLDVPAFFIPLSFQAEVVWTKVVKDTEASEERYEAGIRFLKVDPFDIGRLESFLRLRDMSLREYQMTV